MSANKPLQSLIVDDAIDMQNLFALNNAPTKDAVEVASSLDPMQRAKIAQFCYARQHMRKMGLHIAATCEMPELQRVFGAGAETIYKQSRDANSTLNELNKNQLQYGKKPSHLRVVGASAPAESSEDEEAEE